MLQMGNVTQTTLFRAVLWKAINASKLPTLLIGSDEAWAPPGKVLLKARIQIISETTT